MDAPGATTVKRERDAILTNRGGGIRTFEPLARRQRPACGRCRGNQLTEPGWLRRSLIYVVPRVR